MSQRGFSSIMLIVVIVSLAWMTRFALNFIGHGQNSANMRLQYLRVQAAADAAIEWQRYRLRTQALPPLGGCAPTTNITVPLSTGNVSATVTCLPSPNPAVLQTETRPGPVTTNSYSYVFTAVACSPAGVGGVCPNTAMPLPEDYVERKISSAANCPTSGTPIICTW